MTDLLTLASSIAGLLTAVAALLTILEMRRQRASGFRPDLLLDDADLQFVDQGAPIPVAIRRDAPVRSIHPLGAPVYLDCLNVGVGPAKRVGGRWAVDLPHFVELITGLGSPNVLSLSIEEDRALTVTPVGGRPTIHSLTNQIKVDLPFLLPASVKADPYHLPLPPFYLEILGLLVHIVSTGESERALRAAFNQVPPLFLAIDFRDLEENVHSICFRLTTRFVMISGSSRASTGEQPFAHATVRVDRIKEVPTLWQPAA